MFAIRNTLASLARTTRTNNSILQFNRLYSSKSIFVGNLSYEIKEVDLKQLFERYGEVKSARIIVDHESGRSRGFGFVEMNETDGAAAMAELDGSVFNGRDLKVII